MRKQKGFSLIELLIVVAIILIIAAIAIPSLMKSKMAANDSAATATIRTLITAEVTYDTQYPNTGYAGTLAQLGPGAAACVPPGTDINSCVVDQLLGCAAMPCTKSAYKYWTNDGTAGAQGAGAGNDPRVTPPNTQFTVTGTPLNKTSGSQNVCAYNDGVVRSTKNAIPIVNAPVIPLGADTDFATCGTLANYGPVSGV